MAGNEGLARQGAILDTEVDPRDEAVEVLERRVARLTGELSDTRHELQRVREDTNRALTSLRRQLSPLYGALQRVFGDLEDAGVTDDGPSGLGTSSAAGAAPEGADARQRAVWEPWKAKLPPGCGKLVEALLTHGPLNPTQIKVAASIGSSTVSEAITRMNKLGLLSKGSDGRYALKAL